MGGFTNYEVEFDAYVDWDDDITKHRLTPLDVQYLYLRDFETPRVMLCIYSQTPLEDVLSSLKTLYNTNLRYRVYGEGGWIRSPPQASATGHET